MDGRNSDINYFESAFVGLPSCWVVSVRKLPIAISAPLSAPSALGPAQISKWENSILNEKKHGSH